MGKTDKIDKKVKPKQIEALRKKYESLLEEDKKRKERNEYILEKMDKMRMCTSIVHANTQSHIQDVASNLLCKRLVPLQSGIPGYHLQSYQSFHQEVPNSSAQKSTSSILKDLYSKFILIPKRLPILEATPGHVDKPTSNTDENKDWKSKYEILNKLKQEEKEDLGNDGTKMTSTEHEQEKDYQSQNSHFNQELPEKHVPDTITSKDEDAGNQLYDNSYSKNVYYECPITQIDNTDDIEKPNSYDNFRSPNEIDVTDENMQSIRYHSNTPQDSKEFNYDPITEIDGSEKIEHLDDEGINPAHISYPSENLGKPFGDIPSNIEDAQYPIEVINIEDFTPHKDVIVKDGINVNPAEYGMNQNHFDPDRSHESEIDSTAPPPFQIEKGETTKEPEMSLGSQKSSNEPLIASSTHLTYDASPTVSVPEFVEHTSNPTDATETGPFETEQQEMFYQEPVNEIAFDQRAAVGSWDTTQNENFQQNEQYFYEGPHEQPEAVQINEHEETTTPYDQNYEQQYMGNYEQEYNEISQPFEQSQVSYELTPEYDASQYGQQEYDQNTSTIYAQQDPTAQYNPETEYAQQVYQQESFENIEHVEKQLDNEEGCVVEQTPKEEVSDMQVASQQQSHPE